MGVHKSLCVWYVDLWLIVFRNRTYTICARFCNQAFLHTSMVDFQVCFFSCLSFLLICIPGPGYIVYYMIYIFCVSMLYILYIYTSILIHYTYIQFFTYVHMYIHVSYVAWVSLQQNSSRHEQPSTTAEAILLPLQGVFMAQGRHLCGNPCERTAVNDMSSKEPAFPPRGMICWISFSEMDQLSLVYTE